MDVSSITVGSARLDVKDAAARSSVAQKQNASDAALATTAKTVVGAVNELKTRLDAVPSVVPVAVTATAQAAGIYASDCRRLGPNVYRLSVTLQIRTWIGAWSEATALTNLRIDGREPLPSDTAWNVLAGAWLNNTAPVGCLVDRGTLYVNSPNELNDGNRVAVAGIVVTQ